MVKGLRGGGQLKAESKANFSTTRFITTFTLKTLPIQASASPFSFNPKTMCAPFLYVFILAQCLSLAIGSPLDSLFDPLPSLDGTETSIDNPGVLTANVGGPEEDLIFQEPGGIEILPDPPVSLFPEPYFPGSSFDGVVGGGAVGGSDILAAGGSDILAASNECYPKERACCLRADFNTCYYAPSTQCSNKAIVCCDRIDTVSLAGVGCQSLSQNTQPPSPQPQNTNEIPPEESDEELIYYLLGY